MTESPIPGGNFIVAFNPSVVSAIQDRTLVRVFRDALYPRLLYRGEAAPEQWPVNLGANQTFTRTGIPRPSTRALQANQDPTPKTYDVEQWEASALQYGDAIDTHMPTSYVSLASVYLRNLHQLGLQAGQSLNRVSRDKLFNAYTSGNTVVSAATGASTSLPVVSLNGFTRKLLNGRPSPVSSANPLPITIISGGVPITRNVIAFAPSIAGDEIHGGTLTLDAAHTGVAARDIVLAANRSRVINSGGSTSIDGIGAADQFTMADIRQAVAQMRADNVPVHEDGSYHCHLDPISESQIFGDNEFQRLNQSIPDYIHYREFALAHIAGVTFYRNTEAPLNATVDQDPSYGFTFAPEIFNAPVGGTAIEIHRPIFTGMGALEEKYLDESKYISEAGVIGKIGEFAVQNNGMQVMTDRIRLILRAPLDRLQQQTSAAWSFSGDFPIPTDETNRTSPASFKRAVVVQHGA
jgi:hypothetical protein